MGEIRLQWWRDAITGLADGAVTGHPIADALGEAVRRHGLPQQWLLDMTEAFAFDLYSDPMPDAQAFDGYLRNTQALPFALALLIQTSRDNAMVPQQALALGVEGAARGVGERAGEVQRVEIVGVELAGLAREAIALAHHLDARAIGGAVGIVELAQHRLELHHQLGDALRVRVQRLAPEVGRRRRGRRRRGDAIRPGDAEGRSDERGGEEPGGGPHAIEYDPRAAGRPGLAAGDWSHRWRGATA